jgi:hypothetical protein
MRRPLFFALLALILSLSFAGTMAAPLAQEQRPVIAQPTADSPVRGVVQVVGTATHPEFQRYELYYAPWPAPSDQSWVFIGDAHFNQQPLGLLATWDSRSVPDGAYGLRVRVVKADGNYLDSDARRVLVANTRPAETPTPEASPTSEFEAFPTVPPPTDAAPVAAPTVELVLTAEVQPTPTLEPEETVLVSPTATPRVAAAAGSSSGGDAETSIAGQLFSSSRLLDVAERAATYTLALFLAIGVFFAVKAMLVWLWYKIRP